MNVSRPRIGASRLSRPPVWSRSPCRPGGRSSLPGAAAPHHVAGGQVHGEIALELGVVEEVPLDHVALVAQGHHELLEAVVGVELHDVPEDRPAADLDHRLGPSLGLLGQPCPEAPGQDDHFHQNSSRRKPHASVRGRAAPPRENEQQFARPTPGTDGDRDTPRSLAGSTRFRRLPITSISFAGFQSPGPGTPRAASTSRGVRPPRASRWGPGAHVPQYIYHSLNPSEGPSSFNACFSDGRSSSISRT